MPNKDFFFIEGDSAEFGIDDYNVRVSTRGCFIWDSPVDADRAVVLLDEIDGEHNVCVSVLKDKITNFVDGDEDYEILIGTIYNEVEDVKMQVLWKPETKEILYRDILTGNVWDSDETADNAEEAVTFIYGKYWHGWDLKLTEFY